MKNFFVTVVVLGLVSAFIIAVYFPRTFSDSLRPSGGENAADCNPRDLHSNRADASAVVGPQSEIERGRDAATTESLVNLLEKEGLDRSLIMRVTLAAIEFDLENRRLHDSEPRYWTRDYNRQRERPIDEKLRVLEQKRQIMLALFGEAAIDDASLKSLFRPLDDTLGFLAPRTQMELQRLFLEHEAELNQYQDIVFTDEVRRQRQADVARHEARIREALTLEEYQEYRLRRSPLATYLREKMSSLAYYSEQDFRDIFRIYDEAQVKVPTRFGSKSNQQIIAEQQVRTYFGDARYTEFERVRDPVYRTVRQIAETGGASSSDIIRVYDVTVATREKLRKLNADRSLDGADRRNRFEELLAESHKEMAEIVGEEAANKILSETGRFVWIDATRR